MRGDFTRDTRVRAGRTATRAVLLQQGRPLLDSDFNEEAGLVAARSEAIVRHVVGLHGVPRDDAGFAITAAGGSFTIGAGSLYVEGLPLHNPATLAYEAQFPPGILPALNAAIPDNQEALVHLEAVLRPAIGPDLSDPALDGVETAVREVAGWAVRVTPLASLGVARAALIEGLDRNQDVLPYLGTTGGLDAGVDTQDPDPGPCGIAPGAGYLDQLNRLYRVEIHDAGAAGAATFKWTEDASREASLRASGAGFAIDLPQARIAEWFPTGAVVELIDDDRARAGLTGPMGSITSAPGAQLAIGGVAAGQITATTRIRRWSAMPVAVPANGAWVRLSRGVRVRFATGNYAVGSAWTIPARTVLGDVLWPPYPAGDLSQVVSGQPVDFYAPLEGRRYRAPLALVRRNGNAITVTQDLRDRFPPLTDITAELVRFDDSRSGLGAANVQQAIDALAQREGDCCTWHAAPGTDLQALVDSIPPRANGTLCLATGNYELTAPLRIAGKGHVRVIGVGPGSKLWRRNGAQTLLVENCLSIELADLVVAAEAPGVPEKLGRTGGAVDVSGSGPVRVLRATLIARGRRWKQSAALRVACSTARGGGDVTIEDCDIVAGDLAGGIIVIDPDCLRIENNRIRPRNEAIALTLDRWAQDLHMAAAVGRLAVSYASAGPREPRPATRVDARLFKVVDLDLFNTPFFATTLFSDNSELRRRLLLELPTGQARDFSMRLRQLASRILVHGGTPRLGGGAYAGFQRFYNTIRTLVAPAIDSAIVVGGTHARDVTIAGNRIEGALRGIRVAVNAGVQQQRLPLGTLRIERNLIRLRVAPTDVVRFGIYVGNAERCWIVDNDIAGETADPDFADPRATQLRAQHFDALHAEGVRVVGTLGPLLHIRGNMVRSCPFPFTVTRTNGTDSRAKLWLVQGNYTDGGVTRYRLDASCKATDNI
ncbi:MAG: hypothetical protein J7500_00930 [Sphingomonas sp.]|uniref:hypothetical protein n=1 Tax=Sphingomonas sp. TaxID=28214 RepID=UPI001B099836|nr:hypothetical protein [Sphingomonas sp.]MBO9621251.1 hypothetical protein [Sphingomonas sp.]